MEEREFLTKMINDLKNERWVHDDLIDMDREELIEKLEKRLNKLEKA